MITAVVGFWATLSLNISDFTRYSISQRAQMSGQAIGLPLFMAAFSFISIAITSCSAVIFGVGVSDPIALLSKMDNGPITTVISMAGLLVATLSTNIAANIVAPANAFVNLAPNKLSFKAGGVATAVLGTAILPWKLMADASGYIFVWLLGASAPLTRPMSPSVAPCLSNSFANVIVVRLIGLKADDTFFLSLVVVGNRL